MVIRFLTGDDPVQTPIARDVLDGSFILPATVLLESEWVLRSRYRWTRDMIVAGLRLLIDLPGAHELPVAATWAISRYEHGADFADMIHAASALGASSFATFDTNLAAEAGPDTPLPIETLN